MWSIFGKKTKSTTTNTQDDKFVFRAKKVQGLNFLNQIIDELGDNVQITRTYDAESGCHSDAEFIGQTNPVLAKNLDFLWMSWHEIVKAMLAEPSHWSDDALICSFIFNQYHVALRSHSCEQITEFLCSKTHGNGDANRDTASDFLDCLEQRLDLLEKVADNAKDSTIKDMASRSYSGEIDSMRVIE